MIKKYITYFIKTHKQFVSIQIISSLLFICIFPCMDYHSKTVSSYSNFETMYQGVFLLINAFIVSFAMFKKHYSTPAMDVYGSIPLKREKLYLLDGMIGFGLLFIPYYLFSVMALFYISSLPFDVASLYVLSILSHFIAGATMYILCYSICSIANSKKDVFVFLGSYSIIISGLQLVINILLSRLSVITNAKLTFSNGYSYYEYSYPGFEVLKDFLSANPIFSLCFDEAVSLTSGNVDYTVLAYKVLWLMFALVVLFFSIKQMKHKKVENILEAPKSIFGYPIIIGFMLVTCSFLATFELYFIGYRGIITVTALALIMYLVLLNLYKKKFLHWKSVVVFVACMCSGLLANFVYTATNGFGSYNEYVAYEEVNSFSISSLYYNYGDGISEDEYAGLIEAMDYLVELHKDNAFSKEYFPVTIYIETNGDRVQYDYRIDSSLQEEAGNKLRAIFTD